MSNFIRVLRNTELCANHDAAIVKLQGKLANLQDGEICIASYGDDWGTAKSILGVVRVKDSKRSYTIFDNEDTADILAAIQKLDITQDVTSTDGHVTVKVVQEDGLLKTLEVKTANIAKATELGTKGDAAGTDTAFGRIAQEVADRKQAITDAIAALDSTVAATAESNNQLSVLTGVTQTDGKLTGKTQVTLAAVAKTGSANDVATTAITADETYVGVEGTNVSAQIASIAKTIKGITTTQSNAFKYITVKLTSEEVTKLGDSNVKEAYKVVAYIGENYASASVKETVGDIIKIYKDASIHEIYLGDAHDSITEGGDYSKNEGEIPEADLSLNYVYISDEGKYAMVHIPVGNFLRESEFGNGLQVNNGIVSVKKAEDSETFLTVDGNGIKLSGVQNAIDTAIDALTITKTGTSKDGEVSVTVAQTEGLVSGVTVTTQGLALDSAVVKSVTVNEVPSTFANNNASLTIKGGNIAVADNYTATDYPAEFETKVGTNHIAADDTVDAAFKKTENTISVLATEVISNEKVTTAAVSKLAESAGVTNTNGVIKYTPKDNANYIGAATSVHDATVKLDDAIKTVDDKVTALNGNALTSVAGGNGIEVSTKTSNSQTVSLKLNAAADNALTVDTNGLYLPNVWDCGEY